jgi:hypothetical protein
MYWVLILLVQDPTHQSHILRVAAYSSESNCKTQGNALKQQFGKATDFTCIPADFPN